MAVPQHLQIINPSYRHDEGVLFGQFQMLTTELRLCIWECAVQQQRLLEVEIEPPSDPGDAPPYSTTNALNKLISGHNYTATVRGFQAHSKLLRVNSESRKVALRFYRVHIPCYLRMSGERYGPRFKATFYFNPEYDFMHVTAHQPVEHTFVDFLHDLKAYDPQDVGLLNLALDSSGMNNLYSLANVSEAPARATFVDSLSCLQQIIWVAQSHTGRAIMGPLSDFRSAGVRFNHSMPIKAIKPSFNLLRHDPRPVGPELRYVLTACADPREMRVLWQKLLERWKIRQAQPTRERVLFAYEPLSYQAQIYDIKTANKFLKEEEVGWLRGQQERHWLVMKFAGKVPVEGPEELAKATRPAIGFWLFPAGAFGNLEGTILRRKMVFDMTGYWPELALSHLY
ncbi:hypothetical protein K469DRAFT_721140 [Zopfia rhizophila CBS 207.26]|uniref:2EXR domain-containing protein n=1 Tax=Zopfia rhizophila CBS 207.26 TaxID=1314779 RepID=A0A6A6DEX7_9PEZI|nr:hypothetical protein K469DRAFT_721140 [Zopfia rhizophila CBS 207.26]